jgi:large subunit ribosomal protein L25
MSEIVLQAETRSECGKKRVSRLRKAGKIPGVVYSRGKETISIKIDDAAIEHLISHHAIETMVLSLEIMDGKKTSKKTVIIKEVQRCPVHDSFKHVDFMEISLKEKIHVHVPIREYGDPVGVSQQGGILEHLLRELEVECLPTAVPAAIEVDVSGLHIGEHILVKEIQVPSDVVVLIDPELPVFALVAPKVVEEEEEEGEEEGEEEAAAEPAVIGRGKEKEADEGEGKEE